MTKKFTYQNVINTELILKLMVAYDIADSATLQMKEGLKNDSEHCKKDLELINAIDIARKANSDVIKLYDDFIKGNHDILSDIYEECDKSVSFKIKKLTIESAKRLLKKNTVLNSGCKLRTVDGTVVVFKRELKHIDMFTGEDIITYECLKNGKVLLLSKSSIKW